MRPRGCANCCTSLRPRTSKNLRPRGPRLEARRGRGSGHRGSRPRRPRDRSIRRQGGVHRRGAARQSACAFACSSAAANGMRRGWSRCSRHRRTGWSRAARTSASAAAARCSIWRPPRSWPPRSGNCSTICSASAACGPGAYSLRCADRHWGYRRRARLGVKYVHKKGRVLAGFRERDKPYVADLAPLRDTARTIRHLAAGSGGAGGNAQPAREAAAGRSGRRRRSGGAGVSSHGSAERGRCSKARALWRAPRRADLPAKRRSGDDPTPRCSRPAADLCASTADG